MLKWALSVSNRKDSFINQLSVWCFTKCIMFSRGKNNGQNKKKKNNLLQSDWKFEISIQEINVKKKSLEMLWSMWPWPNLCLRFVFLASVVRISRLMAANTWSKLLFQSRIFSFGNCWWKIVPLAWSYWLPRNFLSDLCSLSSWGC